jgi:uncharacterized protein YbjT (DUF2867 family)
MLTNTRGMSWRLFIGVILIAITYSSGAEEATGETPPEAPAGDLILVAGATGGTGTHVVRQLLEQGYRVRAFVRDIDEARKKLEGDIEFAAGDVRERATIDAALDGVSAIISAIGAGRGDPANGPEFVDYGGTRNLVEAAADAGLNQFVMVSSGGVTHEDHILNKMFNNVLIWKFKGEEIVRGSGVAYTIIRPGGLINAEGGEKALDFQQGDEVSGTIPRADVASVCIAALKIPEAQNKTFELVTMDGDRADDLQEKFAGLAAD